jgi:site-specific recombinase XerD
MAKAYEDGSGWAFRLRVQGQDIYRGGFKSQKAAQEEADGLARDLRKSDKQALLGPQRTSVAQGLSDYAREVLPYHKGAPQEARRINRYLRALGLPLIRLEEFQGNAPVKERLRKRKKEKTVHWTVTFVPEAEQSIPNSLHKHRAAIEAESQATSAKRRKLARTMMADVTKHELQRFVDQMEEEGFGMSTVRLEVAILRQLFGHAGRVWSWSRPLLNPASGLDITTEDNSRTRVLTEEEWQRIAPILARKRNQLVFPLICLMLESAMRSCEPLIHMYWEHVNWERRILELPTGKTGKRNVPLGPGALAILKYVKALGLTSGPTEQVFPTSYEAVKC